VRVCVCVNELFRSGAKRSVFLRARGGGSPDKRLASIRSLIAQKNQVSHSSEEHRVRGLGVWRHDSVLQPLTQEK